MTRDRRTVLLANPGADLYGSDRMAVETVRGLVQHGRRVVVTVPGPGPLVALLEAAGAEVVECPTPIIRKGLLSPRGLLTLVGETVRSILPSLRVLRESGAGTVIVNTITPPLWLALSRLGGRYTICHVHEGEASVTGPLRRALYVPLVFANRVLINSRFSLDVLEDAAPWLAARTHIIYNAVSGPETVVPARAHLDGPVRLLYVGRLSHRKGPHVAVEALSELTRRGIDAHLSLLGAVFPGNEAYADELQALIERHGLRDRVDSLGFKASVWDDIAQSDIVLIPSTVDEPFGNTAVEAALAGRPAIVSDVGGLPEASGRSRSSILVPPSDAGALADAVARISDGWDEYREKAASDAVTVAEAFSSERYSREIAAAASRRREENVAI
ncbi:glycosyltransferase involved in cell wall biosynthesis [Microbacterium foliorum]|uniref:glycosyltransferase family 4 protein n=1 Tax=Microbacterium foliorum TaxID=104336 RepID=UPI00209DE7A6|nr:glycosyltransferase family 4 protein [Microbacterium foliorum]MCP1428849.1 glycosyltransferase involved in cell wall biosynthesis [Microbacterium foliorum]